MNDKKIGILNLQYSTHNYGAVLQAAALEFILKEEEKHDVEHINYIPLRKRSYKSLIRNLLIYIGLLKIKHPVKPANSGTFERFRASFLTRSHRVSKPEEFAALAKQYSTVVVGSDQVWRLGMIRDPAIFFLAYVPEGVNRVSYAASFGAAEWEAELEAQETKLAAEELAKFKAISCRETSGVAICKSVFGVEAVHVLDPLLQVSDEFIEAIINTVSPTNQNLVYYKLDDDCRFVSELQLIESKFGFPAHNLYRREGNLNEYEDVAKWLRYIYDADIVVSDSFHCICLALRFDKTVLFYSNPKRGQARLDDLFDYLGVNVESIIIGGKTMWMTQLKKSESFDSNYSVKKTISHQFISSLNV